MKKLFWVLSLGVLLISAAPQSSNKEAKALLEQATAKIKSYPQLYIDFTYNFVNTRVTPPIVQNETGNIAVKGDNYHLNFMNLEQIRVGNKLYTILKEDEEVQVTAYDPNEAEQGLTPSSLLSSYSKGYSYKLGGTEKIDDKKIQYIVLKPNASEEIDKIMVGINTANKHLYSVKQWATNGTELTLTIKNFDTNKTLPAGYFSFNRKNYANYYISE